MAHSAHVRLVAHATNPPRFHQHIDVTLTHQADGGLEVAYAIHGLNLDLRVPTPHHPAPTDALWRTTCCELFLAPQGQTGYREFNFSSSGQWACYDFIDTRQRSPQVYAGAAPQLTFSRADDLLSLTAVLPAASLPKGEPLRLALSVVLEAEGGHLGYWALAHPPGKPDFHRREGFLLRVDSQGIRAAL